MFYLFYAFIHVPNVTSKCVSNLNKRDFIVAFRHYGSNGSTDYMQMFMILSSFERKKKIFEKTYSERRKINFERVICIRKVKVFARELPSDR